MRLNRHLTSRHGRRLIGACLLLASIAPAGAQVPGGFIEQPDTAIARPALAAAQILPFLPQRGAFTFPAPYNTRGVRLTNASDCGGSDCVWAVGYSYWRNMNNHVGSDVMYAFIGLNQALGGGGPTLFSYNKLTDEVRNLGPLFAPGTGFASRSGEGWYFSATQPTKMYLDEGPRMLRFDVLTKQSQVVYDVRAQFGADKTLWQMHSSDDDRVHSATLVDGSGMLGCVVYHEDTAQFQFFPKVGEFNECAVDKGGRWAMSVERTQGGSYGDDMRIFNLATGAERRVLDQDGGVGHADMGYDSVVGADNWANQSNAYKLWDFNLNPLAGSLVSYNNDWTAPGPNHVSHTNARADIPEREQYACGSSAAPALAVWGNEVVCFRLDGSKTVAVIAPVMTNMAAPSGGDDYNKQPKGNLDVTGQYFLWTSNTGGSRVDAFIVKVPSQLLGGSTPPPPPPPPPSDLVPPVISLVASSGITTSAATITWLTGELGDSQVEYGLTTAYGSNSPLASTLLLSHSTALSGLTPGTLYHYRVKSSDAAGNLGVSADATFTTAAAPVPPPPPPPSPPPVDPTAVVWGSLVNVTVTGNVLKKTGGCNGCADAGAVSNQQIASGDGYLEFTVTETNLVRYIGLTSNVSGTGSSLIRHGFRLGSGRAEVRELGKYRREVTIVTGDLLRIAVQAGVVRYSKNGAVFYTSTLAPVYPLRADTSFSSLNATLANVRLVGIAAPPAGPQAVAWTSLVNAAANGTVLTKTGGCDGCEDAGAVSQQQIASGDGYFEFTVSETNYVRYAGLNPASTGTGAAEIPHAFKLVNGTAEVRELGQYKWDIAVATGDVLRIAVQSGVVKYSKNGAVFYTSAAAAAYPLRVDSALASSGATIANAVIATTVPEQVQSSGAPVVPPLASATPASAGALDLRWLALLLTLGLVRASASRRAGTLVHSR